MSLLDTDGENRAVRYFLLGRELGFNSVPDMRMHMRLSGFDKHWPEWVESETGHLTKAGAQAWIRYLFGLEVAPSAQAIETAAIMRAMKVVDGWASTASEYGFDGDMEQFMRVKVDIEALIPQGGRTQLEELLSKFAEALLIEINGNYGTAHVSDGPLWHVIVKRAIRAIVANLIGEKK